MSIIDHIIGMIESRIELFKIEAKEETAFFLARAIVAIMLGLFLFFTWLFLAMGLGLFLNWSLDSSFLGVLIIGVLHLILFLLIYGFRNALGLEKVIRKILDTMFDNRES